MSELNASQFLALRIREAAEFFRRQVEKMPAGRVDWRPAVEGVSGRSALDQARECAAMNDWAARIFASRIIRELPPEGFAPPADGGETVEETLDWLEESAARLSMAIAGFPSVSWGTVVSHPFTRQPASWAEVSDAFYWNLVYHTGQVCYIQTLYGDISFP